MFDPSHQYTHNLTFLQSIIDAVQEGVVIQNHEGKIIGFNEQACEILAVSPDALTGNTSHDTKWIAYNLDGSIIPVNEHPIVRTLQTGEPNKDVVMGITTGKQEKKWVSVNTKILHIEKEKFAFATFMDITSLIVSNQALAKQQEALKQSEENFYASFNYSPIGKALVGIDGKWINANNALCDITGYTKAELLQKTFQDITHPDDLQKDLALFHQLLNKAIETYQLEKRYIRKDGSIIWVMIYVSMVWNSDQSPRFCITQIQEVSSLKQLNQELGEQNTQLLQTQMELEKKIGQLKDFAGIITHDVRGPATNIRRLLDIYEQGRNNESGSQAMEHLKKASIDLTDNLNELIKLLQWHLEKKSPFVACNFQLTCEGVCQQLSNLMQAHQATINCKFDVVNMSYSKVYLQSIFYNLISNALKYARPGIPAQITIATYEQDGRTCLEVTDNGLGIDLDKYGSAVFKFQKRFHDHADSKGIGLYLVKHQVEEFGGTINVTSKVNEGTSFTIVF